MNRPPRSRFWRAGALTAVTGLIALNATVAVRPASALVVPWAAGGDCPNAKGFEPGTPNETSWAQKRMDLERVWAVTRGAGVTVAVIDSGVNFGHVLMQGVRRKAGFSMVGGSTTDCLKHGTEVASIIAAQQVAGYAFSGVAPDATIMPVKEQNADNDGDLRVVAQAIRRAVDAKADVINLSLNGPADNITQLRDAIAYAEQKDVVVVCAANNDNARPNATTPYPAGYPTVLAVASTNQQDQHSQFSHSGSFVDIAAPGEKVEVVTPINGDRRFHIVDGTSYAAPIVAGVAALVRAAHPDLNAAQVRERILRTADAPPGKVPSPDLGYGIVNPYLAVTASIDDTQSIATPKPSGKPASIPVPASADGGPRHRALGFGLALFGLAGLVASVAAVARRGRARGWRSA
jgi:membrane-anchored mycosin MYCP